ncbi:hypothetical protein SAMN05216352_1325 [Alteribacillus bidgolensis]|uniref:Uncharacterized protein n=1 Tax=Alteribacillus bidgolensis TaxID=930129 RepID=A0A1G8RSV9_9BACI|nr:hypothetical protein SAMN05216352_1325 [Alteribacillus bidgolensis]
MRISELSVKTEVKNVVIQESGRNSVARNATFL